MERGGSSTCTSSSPAWWPVSRCSPRRPRAAATVTVDVRVGGAGATLCSKAGHHRPPARSPRRRSGRTSAPARARAARSSPRRGGVAAAEAIPFGIGVHVISEPRSARHQRGHLETFWHNYRYSSSGVCTTELQESGDDVRWSRAAATLVDGAVTASCLPPAGRQRAAARADRAGERLGPGATATMRVTNAAERHADRGRRGGRSAARRAPGQTAWRSWGRSRSGATRSFKASKPGTIRSNRGCASVSATGRGRVLRQAGSGGWGARARPARVANDKTGPATTLQAA